MRLSKKKSFNEIKQKPCGERSPYWEWLSRHVHNDQDHINEPAEGNPDMLSESDHLYASRLSPLAQEQLSAIYASYDILTPKERAVVELVGARGFSLEKVALILKITKNTVWSKLNRARRKILKFYETR